MSTARRVPLATAVLAQPLLTPRSTSRVAVLLTGEREYAMDLLTIHVQHAVTFITTLRKGVWLLRMAVSRHNTNTHTQTHTQTHTHTHTQTHTRARAHTHAHTLVSCQPLDYAIGAKEMSGDFRFWTLSEC